MEPVYLDYNATTPVDPEVAKVMQPFLGQLFGNPSSLHRYGVEAKRAVEEARRKVANLLNADPDEIVFTSGGSESNNFAIKGVAFANRGKGNHIITTSIEHPAVAEVCRYLEKHGFRITWLPVDDHGCVDPADVEASITPSTILISVMHANNETGSIQPVEAIGAMARSHGIPFHSDAAQSAGKIVVDVQAMKVDLLSLAGHKLYAPKGVGALYIRRGIEIEKLIHGADHESNQRAGTENIMQIAALGKAAELAIHKLARGLETLPEEQRLRDMLHSRLQEEIPSIRLNGHPEFRLPNTLSLGFPGIEAPLMLDKLKGVAASAGAACHSDDEEVSGVLAAMRVPREYALGTIRFSTGRMTTDEEIETAVPLIVEAYRQLTGEAVGSAPELGEATVRMTRYTHALGCACKIRPQMLERILRGLPVPTDPNLLVGFETSDDAAVYRIDGERAIVQTVDFIPPVVDDPYTYGAIAAANALSDIYAMGGKPLFALSVVGFPDKILPASVLHQILKGAGDKAAEAGISIVGGHSVEDSEPKFGLVVTGMVHPGKILKNGGARGGDAIVITKPVGTGIVTTAIKRGLASDAQARRVSDVMMELNRRAGEVMADFPVNGCTDVTGFGLLGHLREMVLPGRLSADLFWEKVPVIEGAWDLAVAGAIPGGTKNNLLYVEELVHWSPGVPALMKMILADAQTSGGLLIALPAEEAQGLVTVLRASGITEATIIGKVMEGESGIRVL